MVGPPQGLRCFETWTFLGLTKKPKYCLIKIFRHVSSPSQLVMSWQAHFQWNPIALHPLSQSSFCEFLHVHHVTHTAWILFEFLPSDSAHFDVCEESCGLVFRIPSWWPKCPPNQKHVTRIAVKETLPNAENMSVRWVEPIGRTCSREFSSHISHCVIFSVLPSIHHIQHVPTPHWIFGHRSKRSPPKALLNENKTKQELDVHVRVA